MVFASFAQPIASAGHLISGLMLLRQVMTVFFKILGRLQRSAMLPSLPKNTGVSAWQYANRDCSWHRMMALSSLTVTCLLGAAQLGSFQTMELKAFDRFTQLSATYQKRSIEGQPAGSSEETFESSNALQEGASGPLVVVAITEADIQAQKEWPFSDQVFADLLDQLQRHAPEVIGLDIYRDVPHTPGTSALAQQLQKENVVTITKLDNLGEGEVPSPLKVPEDRVGFNDFVIDPDGVIRRNFMFAALGDRELYSFSLRLIEQFLASQNLTITAEPNAIKIGNTRIPGIITTAGGYQTIDAAGYQTIMRYFPPEAVARQISLTEVLSGEFDPEWIAGKIVLIGTTAPSQKDLFYTPFSSQTKDELLTAGVTIHAQMTRQILSAVQGEHVLLSVLPQWGEFLWVWMWGLGGGLIIWRFSHPHVIMMAAAAGFTALTGLTGLLFVQAVWVPFVLPAVAFGLTGAVLVVYKEFRKTFYDSITGLPNRTLFTQELQDTLKKFPHRSAAVISLDVDRFKVFNESFGLQVGDRLLQIMAKRLKHYLPSMTKVARIAGDEFVISLSDVDRAEDAIVMAKALTLNMATPIIIDGQKLFPTVSAGIAFHPASDNLTGSTNRLKNRSDMQTSPESEALTLNALNAEDMLRDAQTAMSRAKLRGRGRCELFVTDMRTQLSNRLWLESDLRNALHNNEFLLYYQPLICFKTMTIAGFEALIRWEHPTKGMISPGEFIPIAEDTGLIIPIGQWVLEDACKQAQRWRLQFPTQAPFISVNLSGRQFSQQDLVEQIDRILMETQLERSALKLELTESVVMDDVEASIDVLLQLKALNLQLGIDDFGTGYSSLSYLHRFPIDTLKVDRSFVMEMEEPGGTAELVKTIIALGHNLGMNVVAEGIETQGQSQTLEALQCEYAQGYLFSKPLPAQAAQALLAQATNWKQHSQQTLDPVT